jgi:hypothetical protein
MLAAGIGGSSAIPGRRAICEIGFGPPQRKFHPYTTLHSHYE